MERSLDLLARVLTYPGPTVAAMSGHAFGYGAMLALIRARLLPQTAHRAITTGYRYGAADALAAGIVEHLTEPDAIKGRPRELAADGAGKAPTTLKKLKSDLYADLYADVLAAPRLGR